MRLKPSFFFSSRRRHTRCLSDWSSDVCSSDLQVLDVGIGHHHTLRAGESFDAADVKEPLDFFVYSANGLNSALLVDRAGDGDVLAKRQSGKRRRERVDFR